jgi:hypothetical protein
MPSAAGSTTLMGVTLVVVNSSLVLLLVFNTSICLCSALAMLQYEYAIEVHISYKHDTALHELSYQIPVT